MSVHSMTASELRELLRVGVSNMLDKQTTAPDSRLRPFGGEPISVADSRAVTADLHRYFTDMTVNDPRLVALVSFRFSLDEFIDAVGRR